MKYENFQARTDRNVRSWNLAWWHSFWRWSRIHQQKTEVLLIFRINFQKRPRPQSAAERRRAPTLTLRIGVQSERSEDWTQRCSDYPATIARIRTLVARTCESTKIPAGMQKPDLWTFRYASEQNLKKWPKPWREMTKKPSYICSFFLLPLLKRGGLIDHVSAATAA